MTISPINLGSFYTNSSGSSVSSGISSGLNTDSLIKAITAAQDSQVTALKDQVDVNNKQSTALTSLKQTLTSLQSALKPLSNPSSFDYTTNLFAVRTANLTSNTSQSASNYVTASVASGTASGTYVISDISQLATNTTQETNEFTLAGVTDSVVPAIPAAGYFKAGTITVNGQSVTINEGDSLGDIASAFNAVKDSTGISASVLQTAPGKYKLIFTSTTTGYDARFDLQTTGVGHTISSDPSGVFSNITITPDQNGENASFKLNNVTVTRPTNNIDDLISGVTFNLQQDTTTTPGAAITLSITPDYDSIVTGVDNFANAYNKFLSFYAQQTERDSSTGAPKDTAVLSNDATLNNIYNSLSSLAASIVKGLANDAPNSFSSIGISFTDYAGDSTTPAVSNILSVDNSTLRSVLTTNLDGVSKVFGDSFTSSSTHLSMYQAPTNAQGITDLTFNINQSGSTYTASYVDSNGDTQTVNFTATTLSTGGISLKADTNSALAGMIMLYTGTGDESGITSTLTQGILAQMNTFVNSSVKAASGLIASDQQAITDKNTSLQDRITQITDQTNILRDSLLKRFSELEAAITKANSVLSLLNAQQLAGKG